MRVVVPSSPKLERAEEDPVGQPAYLKTYSSGLLASKIEEFWSRMEDCRLCPRECGVDRVAGEVGVCQTGAKPLVSSYSPHFGEEAPLVGRGGSGTIFFAHCNLGCLICQNEEISLQGRGQEVSLADLAMMMLDLQAQGCHNINFVTPTHVIAHILAALSQAIEGGLRVPLVYNCGGYDKVETLKILEGVFDIYMPDFKFADPETARRISNAPDYPQQAKAAITEMHRQVGDLLLDEDGVAVRGLLVRHLVLPNRLAGSRQVFEFLAGLSKKTYLNVMAQYRPCGLAYKHKDLNRRLELQEHAEAVKWAFQAGLTRLDEPQRRFFLRF